MQVLILIQTVAVLIVRRLRVAAGPSPDLSRTRPLDTAELPHDDAVGPGPPRVHVPFGICQLLTAVNNKDPTAGESATPCCDFFRWRHRRSRDCPERSSDRGAVMACCHRQTCARPRPRRGRRSLCAGRGAWGREPKGLDDTAPVAIVKKSGIAFLESRCLREGEDSVCARGKHFVAFCVRDKQSFGIRYHSGKGRSLGPGHDFLAWPIWYGARRTGDGPRQTRIGNRMGRQAVEMAVRCGFDPQYRHNEGEERFWLWFFKWPT